VPTLFCEAPGAVIAVRAADAAAVRAALPAAFAWKVWITAQPSDDDRVRIVDADGRIVFDRARTELRGRWSDTTYRLQRCATIRAAPTRSTRSASIPASPA
jgi:hypothetical protein